MKALKEFLAWFIKFISAQPEDESLIAHDLPH